MLDGTTADGVIWEAKVHAGLYMRCRAEISNCNISNFSNAGVHIQTGGGYVPPSLCNTWYLSRIGISFCGLGVATIGTDTNAGYSEGLDISNVGQTWTHTLRLTVAMRSFSVRSRATVASASSITRSLGVRTLRPMSNRRRARHTSRTGRARALCSGAAIALHLASRETAGNSSGDPTRRSPSNQQSLADRPRARPH